MMVLNIVAIDCDAGISEVNQLNRIKLMLSVAKEKIAEQDIKLYKKYFDKVIKKKNCIFKDTVLLFLH